MSVMIITDSTAYLPAEIIDQYKIQVVPLNVHMPDKDFKEGQVSNAEYYNILKTSKVFPTTSQPAAGDFLEIFKTLQPGDEALVILISSLLSGTVQSAQIASGMVETENVKITVVDSLSTTMGLGFQVIKACEMLEAGKSTAEITAELIRLRDNMQIFFVVNNLEYLARGGRISKLGSIIGNILQLKPVLFLKDGEIALFDKVRTFSKAKQSIIDKLKHTGPVEKICVVHVDAPAEGEALKAELQNFFSVPISMSEPGPVIGSHVGPGTVGLIYY